MTTQVDLAALLANPQAAEALFTQGPDTDILSAARATAEAQAGGREADSAVDPASPDAASLVDEAIEAITAKTSPEAAQALAAKPAPEDRPAKTAQQAPDSEAEDNDDEATDIDLDAALSPAAAPPAAMSTEQLQAALFEQTQRQNAALMSLLQRQQAPAPAAQQTTGPDWSAIAQSPEALQQIVQRAGLEVTGQNLLMAEVYARGQAQQQDFSRMQALFQQQQAQQQLVALREEVTPRVRETLERIVSTIPKGTRRGITDQVVNAMAYGWTFEDAFKAAVQPMVPLLQQLRASERGKAPPAAKSRAPAPPKSPEKQAKQDGQKRALRVVAAQGQSGGRHNTVTAQSFDPKNVGLIEDRLFRE